MLSMIDEDLWDGILSQHFIFNFKNSLFINAYDALEKEFRKISNSVQDFLTKLRGQKETE